MWSGDDIRHEQLLDSQKLFLRLGLLCRDFIFPPAGNQKMYSINKNILDCGGDTMISSAGTNITFSRSQLSLQYILIATVQSLFVPVFRRDILFMLHVVIYKAGGFMTF